MYEDNPHGFLQSLKLLRELRLTNVPFNTLACRLPNLQTLVLDTKSQLPRVPAGLSTLDLKTLTLYHPWSLFFAWTPAENIAWACCTRITEFLRKCKKLKILNLHRDHHYIASFHQGQPGSWDVLIQYISPVASTLDHLDISMPMSHSYLSQRWVRCLLPITTSLCRFTKLKSLTTFEESLFIVQNSWFNRPQIITAIPPSLEHLQIKRPTKELLEAIAGELVQLISSHFSQLHTITLHHEQGKKLPDPPTMYASEKRMAIVAYGVRVEVQWSKHDHVEDWFDGEAKKLVSRVQESDLRIG
jgi:hypothetical protein